MGPFRVPSIRTVNDGNIRTVSDGSHPLNSTAAGVTGNTIELRTTDTEHQAVIDASGTVSYQTLLPSTDQQACPA